VNQRAFSLFRLSLTEAARRGKQTKDARDRQKDPTHLFIVSRTLRNHWLIFYNTTPNGLFTLA
jgi:hypothetical protein